MSVNEKELLECLRLLVIESTRNDEEDDGGEDGGAIEVAMTDESRRDDLIHDVELKLTQFLEVQFRMDDQSEFNATGYSPEDKIVLPIHQPHAYPCPDTHKTLPSPPSQWPQRPVMIRPTPGTSTKIRGIRLASDRDYRHFAGFCAGCILPVNTGREAAGQSLVVDFESNHFVGTFLLRIKGVPPADKNATQAKKSKSYFDNRKRKFQGIVKGKFKTALPMSECVTGQTFGRQAGKLPAKWVVSTFIKFVSTLAPQLETTLEGDNPRFLVPLAATAQTVATKPHKAAVTQQEEDVQQALNDHLFNYSVYLGATEDIEHDHQEPPSSDETSILQELPKATTSSGGSITARMKARKKAFNSIAAKQAKEPCFSLDKEYTFEFYQHLLIFDEPEFTLDMGRPIGKVPLSPITDGQPIKFLSAHKDPVSGLLDSLWSFDVWHESMYPLAQKAADRAAAKR
ncbi:expressed unknown protein [Seminavis robusta]|uniref:Domain of unknown function at the cortex 1 domain-containing protein n=1 Tax=Seminavis robusta TaxID=568900 RepID=A0A9N8H7Z9_9STRA|nr:expressed unknown protein [Seminavis robusta]|eukprot:Sro144_g066940.1 n/a (456) ;mRNA; f:33502-34960